MKPIENDLLENGYMLNPVTKVFESPTYADIAYNDGDESENRILKAIKDAKDIDSLSDELEKHCTDWPSTYHLSKKRGNLLRPFLEHFKNKTILEIGSGMGPITRLLGESGADVLALKGTSRRANATRLRTRDLNNVFVLAERFDTFKTNIKYDFITLVGVLEYSNLYVDGLNPHLRILTQCYEMLKPEGSLIVAIENKLGLKYFAGFAEDHVGIPMFGLENRYNSKSVRTFGKSELTQLLISSGYKSIKFNAPLPDYKLTTSVISENGFLDENFNTFNLIHHSLTSDPQLPEYLNFVPELVFDSLSENKLDLELSNSFLVFAEKESETFLNQNSLAWHFSTSRKKAFCTRTEFVRKDNDTISILKSKLLEEVAASSIKQEINGISRYSTGVLFRNQLDSLLSRSGWTHSELQTHYEKYYEFLLRFRVGEVHNSNLVFLRENSFDLIHKNIVAQGGVLIPFDLEWRTEKPIDIRQILFRSVTSLHSLSIFANNELGFLHSIKTLFTLI